MAALLCVVWVFKLKEISSLLEKIKLIDVFIALNTIFGFYVPVIFQSVPVYVGTIRQFTLSDSFSTFYLDRLNQNLFFISEAKFRLVGRDNDVEA